MEDFISFLLIYGGAVCLYLVSKLLGTLYRFFFARQHRPTVRTENIRPAAPPNRPRSVRRPAPKRTGSARPPGWIGFKRNGLKFEFQMVRVGSEVRSYILAHPRYASRSTGPHETHRLFDTDRQRHYVCTGWPPETFEEAKEWTRVWCRYTEHYIRTGQSLTS